MLYKQVQDIPGRLRLRCGRGRIGEAEAAGIAEALQGLPGIAQARVAPANGSILVTYAPGDVAARAAALDYVARLDLLSLPQANPDAQTHLISEKSDFYRDIALMVLRRNAMRLLMPPQLGAAITVVRAIPFALQGLRCLLRGEITVDVLDSTAIGLSLLRRNFSSAASIMFLLSLSDRIQEHVNARTRIALQDSLLARADTVWRIDPDGVEREIRLSDLALGDAIRIRDGQTIPVDGTVISGDASVNEASLTGEAAPVHKDAGATVYAGTTCEAGSIALRAEALAGSSRIDKIVRLVEESSEHKASVQAQAERLADALVPGSFAAMFATLAVTRDLNKASSVLMVDFSCAIKLSTPVAVMSAMREASHLGAVIKGGKYLEALADADVIVFDKTGTLTTATPTVERIITFGGMDEDEALKLAACLEEHFPHSLARSIVAAAQDAGIHHEDEAHAEVEYVVAHGIVSKAGDRRVCLGSAHFVFDDEGIPKPDGLDGLLEREVPGLSAVYLAIGDELKAVLCISDPLRPEAAGVLAHLREAGITHQVMLTGDSPMHAAAVARALGIDEFHAQVLPEDKSRFVEELKASGRTVIMVGDGINDSPALAAASVSIALNDASDIARAVADISVMGSSLESLLTLRALARALMRRVHRDYRFIVGFNAGLIALGIASVLPPTTAALLHNASTVAITAANTRKLLPGA